MQWRGVLIFIREDIPHNLFQNYLNDRKQRVVLNGSFSEFTSIESGVPQGSILGPLLFLIYINDLETNIKSNIKFFADDTMLYSIVKDPNLSAIDLNHDLDVISGLINGNLNLILIPLSKQLKFYFPVKTMLQTIHKLFSMEL